MSERVITGRHVALLFCSAFGVILAVNLLMAFQAVRTFPGLEVKNSYVASQTFDADRAAQEALGWDVSARFEGDALVLRFDGPDGPVRPEIINVTLGRATEREHDRVPDFLFNGQDFIADVAGLAGGKWDLRLEARARDGTLFRQRLVVRTDT